MTMGICFAMILSQIPAFAAGSVSVSADKSSANVEDKVTVTVQTSEPEDPATAPQISITYDTELLNFESCNVEYGGGGGGLITVTGTSAEIQFSALKEGNAAVNAEAIIDDDGNNPATGAASISIGGAAPTEETATQGTGEGSSDAALKALVVSPGTMIPAFSPEVTDYKIYVDEDVTDVKISGGVRDDNAKITAASGFKNLEMGTNLAIVSVTAEDGTLLTYNFKIERGGEVPADAEEMAAQAPAADTEEADAEEADDSEETATTTATSSAQASAGSMEIDVDGATYTIQTSIPEGSLPSGSVRNSIDYYGTTIDGAFLDAASLQLVYAVSNDDGSGEFFVYDDKAGSFVLFVQIKGMNGKYIVPMAVKGKVPSGFEEENMTWNNASVPAYQLAKKSIENADVFYLLYAVNQDGIEDFYLYDAEEESYQRFLNYGGKVSSGSAKMGKGASILIGCLLIVLVGAVLLIITLLIKNRELNSDIEILAHARERRKNTESAPKKAVAPKQVIVPDQAQQTTATTDVADPQKKVNPKKVNVAQKTVDPDVQTEIPPMAQLAKGNEVPSEPEVKVAEPKTVEPIQPAASVAVEQELEEDDTAYATDSSVSIEGSMDDLSDVADLLNNEENIEFTKMLASFSTGRVNVVTPQTRPQSRAARPVAAPVTPVAPVQEAEPEVDMILGQPEENENIIPVVNVERPSVSLTREALPDEPDDDFEFEFINLDEN